MSRFLLAPVVLLGLSVVPAWAQTTLEWKFKAGDKFFLQNANRVVTTTEVLGQTVKEDKTTTQVSRFTVKEQTKDGYVLEQEILRWTDEIKGGVAGDQALDKATRGAKFTLHLTPQGKVTKYEGYEGFMKRVEDEFPNDAGLLRALLTEQALRSTVELVFQVLPAGPVKMGDTWKNKLDIPVGFVGRFEYDTQYTYEGKKGDVETFKSKASFKFHPPTKDVPGQPFKVVSADLKSSGAEGLVRFDPAKGRIKSIDSTLPMGGTMTMDIMGMNVEVTLNARETRTILVLDRNPVSD